MKEIKQKLKELASLCIDKGLHFDCNFYENRKSICWTVWNLDGNIKYISDVSEVAAEWRECSIKRIQAVIDLVENNEY